MKKTQCFLILAVTTALCATTADDTAARVINAAAALKPIVESGHGIPAEKLAGPDCIDN